MKILVLEDDYTLARELLAFFGSKDFECECIYDGQLFLRHFLKQKADLYLLDINVPGVNGVEVCQAIRNVDKKTPILMLTAFGEIEDKVSAFSKGADDYLVKPFHFDELFMRVTALLRRRENSVEMAELIEVGDLRINVSESTVTRAGERISLTPKEYRLLLILARAKGRVVSKQNIAEDLWDDNVLTSPNTIEVYINFLRKKIDSRHSEKLIQTRTGYGYYLKQGD
ncbi:MAG: response regulator transcription factor [Bacteroidia bacterium]|nr:response regulator transcription factor [Bacteroidia bacterium]